MGTDAGFDMFPPLTKSVADRQKWEEFIGIVRSHYKGDSKVEIKSNCIEFKAGEHPTLPFAGHKFLRFSSKITGSNAAITGVDKYIDTVTRMAKTIFGFRVHHWDELFEKYGVYDWNEVNESLKSYDEPDEPDIKVDMPSSVSETTSGADPVKESSMPIFEIRDIPGKGRGLLARVDIPQGTRILCEKPLVTAGSMPIDELESYLAAKLKALPKASQQQFLALHNNFPGKYPFSYTFKTNALPCGPDTTVGGVYPTICLVNHSCMPNCHNNWNSNTEHETIHAIRPIKAGDEITIPYDHGGPSAERSASLKKSFGFQCDCSICSLPAPELHTSDTRRRLIQSLDKAIGDPFRMGTRPHESLADCHKLLQTLSDEYNGHAGVLNARLYYDAFQVSIAHGDQARAGIFAERSYKARVVCEGEDSPATKRMRGLASKPASHGSFRGCSSKWNTTKTMVPKGLDTEEFGKWLFRM